MEAKCLDRTTGAVVHRNSFCVLFLCIYVHGDFFFYVHGDTSGLSCALARGTN